MLSLEFFYRFLLSKRAGSLVKTIARISIVGIWLGVSALIIVVSVMNGFNRSITDRLLEVEPHMVVKIAEAKNTEALLAHPIVTKLNEKSLKLISPTSQQDVILRTEEGFVQHAVAHGVTRERLMQLLEYANRKADQNDPELQSKIQELKPGEVVLGMGLADSIGLFYDNRVVVIPPELLLMPASERTRFSSVTVKGFLVTDVDRIDGSGLFYIIDQSIQNLGSAAGRELGLEVWLQDPHRADQIKQELISDGVKIETWAERNASLFFALKIEKVVVSFLVGLSTLIAGLSILSVMVLLITQKRKDLGNLLAMGMTPSRARHIFLNIGMLLAMSGVVAGVLTGVIAALLINQFSHDVLPAFYEETNIPAEVRIYQLTLILTISLGFSFFALKSTITKVTGFRPSEILRG